MKKIKFPFFLATSFLTITIPLASLLLNVKPAIANTIFFCGKSSNGYATFAWRDSYKVLLVKWETRFFAGSSVPLQIRCRQFAERLNRAVENNGGQLSNLWLTTGRFNGYPVICYKTGTDRGCNENNILLTMSRSYSPNPGRVLRELFDEQSIGGVPIYESQRQDINLEGLVASALPEGTLINNISEIGEIKPEQDSQDPISLQESLERYRKAGNRVSEAATLTEMGEVYEDFRAIAFNFSKRRLCLVFNCVREVLKDGDRFIRQCDR